MSSISTHVLNLAAGRPAEGITVVLEYNFGTDDWREIGQDVTTADGRISSLLPKGSALHQGFYRMTFQTGPYFSALGEHSFYPYVVIHFEISDQSQHHHVPLLISMYGYSTYRGS